jgi:Pyruvate/2-oxoacid:ferredoxin oxidoreductase gamma subunit
MVMLGYLQEATRLFSAANLLDVVRENVPNRFVDLNLRAVKHGIALAKDNGTKVES